MTDRPPLGSLPAPPASRTVPEGFRARLSAGVMLWAGGRVVVGGSPWKVSTLSPAAQEVVLRLRAVGARGIALDSSRDRAVLRVLLDRGFAECAPAPSMNANVEDVEITIPVLDDPERLQDLLATLPTVRVVVIDDGSTDADAIADVASSAGARTVRHEVNRGPAAARNTALQSTTASFVAFIDADCLADPSWPSRLLHHFDDPAVAAVAARVTPDGEGSSLLERYEAIRSSLDMGDQPELVRPGARLGFVPSAALVVRRSAIQPGGFDEGLRLGEDVDLVWRLADAGWLVRYDPSVVVRHRTRARWGSWLRRKLEYGTSAPDLEMRHPGRLAPARPSLWTVATLALIATGRPWAGVVLQAVPFAVLSRRFAPIPEGRVLAARVTAQGVLADTMALGQAMRREWWPVGAVALVASPWSRTARIGALMVITPLLWEWADRRPPMNPAAFTVMRLIDDAAYGTGVITASVRARQWRTLAPRPRGTARAVEVMNGILRRFAPGARS